MSKQTSSETNNDNSTAATETEESESAPSMELNLRLDENGRTTFDPVQMASATICSHVKKDQDIESHPSKKPKIHSDQEVIEVDYSSKTTMTSLHGCKMEDAMDALLFDCEITDCGLLPRTFWIPSQGLEPRCFLETLALQIFHHHVPHSSTYFYDPKTSGAEWWVQIRPSPPAGRYSMLTDKDESSNDMAKSGISFHWDKDEDLRLLCGGSMYIHPHLSTVTYLTDIGAPTMVLSKRVDPMSGDTVMEDSDVTGFVSWPKRGKHLSFDGRYLHAAPSDLMEENKFEEQCTFKVSEHMSDQEKKVLGRRHRRVTFLVNIWLNYKPLNVNPFPETMLNSLSAVDLFGEFNLFDTKTDTEQPKDRRVCATLHGSNEIIATGKLPIEVVPRTWPMGSCDDEKHIMIPISTAVIHDQALTGSNVYLSWQAGMIRLSRLEQSADG